MSSRWYKKQQTRKAMVDGALAEIEQGRSFDSLSLREVTRAAGIAPTTFYRHFQDMDELGQALIEAAEQRVAEDAKCLRNDLLAEGESVRHAIEGLVAAMQEHPSAYRLLLNLRMGPSPILRAASRRVLQSLAEAFAGSLTELAAQRRRPVAEPIKAAEAITSLIWGQAGDIMAQLHQSPEAITEQLLVAVRLILTGAEQKLAPLDNVVRQIA